MRPECATIPAANAASVVSIANMKIAIAPAPPSTVSIYVRKLTLRLAQTISNGFSSRIAAFNKLALPRLSLSGIVLTGIALGACGGSDAKPAPGATVSFGPPTPLTITATIETRPDAGGTEAALRAAAGDQAKAFYRGDAQSAYRTFAKECRAGTSYGEFAPSLAVGASYFESFMKAKLSDVKVASVDIRSVANGRGEAYVHAKLGDLSLDSPSDSWVPWVYQDGHWLDAKCEDMKISTN